MELEGKGQPPTGVLEFVRRNYAWVVVGVTFLALLVAAGVRSIPGVFMLPMESELGWDRSSISLAVAVSLLAFGFGAPLAGGYIDRHGPRRVMIAGLTLIAAGLAPMIWMSALWQLFVLWGIVVGVGTGAVANVLGASVAGRWFVKSRGIVVGLFAAASSAGQLIFLPLMMAVTVAAGWRTSVAILAVTAAVMILPTLLLMRDRPSDVGLRPYGDDGATASPAAAAERGTPLSAAIRTKDFWFLAGSFFVCGYTSNGLVGTHLIPHAIEHGFTQVAAASAVALMGSMNVVGTLASGWLTDRYDNRKLLAAYYGFRALSIAALPFIFEMQGLLIFAVVYGLDWIATVPPTVNLTANRFGRASIGTLYGWIFCAHMIGASLAAYAGGFFRTMLGDYHLIFISAAVLGIIAVGLAMSISPARKSRPAAA